MPYQRTGPTPPRRARRARGGAVMAWQIVAEILDHCPDLPYRQFRVLVALGHDAKPRTRQCSPGGELLAMRANCGIRTASRALAELHRLGLVKTITPAAPRRTAVYEIGPMPGATYDTSLSYVAAPERVSIPGERMSTEGSTYDNEVSHPTKDPTSRPTKVSARARTRDARPLLAELGATPAEIDFIIEKIETNPRIRDTYAYVRKAGRDLLGGHRLNGHRAAPPRGRNEDPVHVLAAPPCPVCGEPYSPGQLTDPGFRLAAIRGEAGCIHEPAAAP